MHYRRNWVEGEVLQALAYDVPIPGYKTKNTISLRLWEAKATAEDFDLFQFNDGQHESAAQLHSRAQQVGCPIILVKRGNLATIYPLFSSTHSSSFIKLLDYCTWLSIFWFCLKVWFPLQRNFTYSYIVLRLFFTWPWWLIWYSKGWVFCLIFLVYHIVHQTLHLWCFDVT